MNRRSFMKLMGISVMAPMCLAGPEKISTVNPVFIVQNGAVKRLTQPLIIDGKEYYVMMMHPQQHYDLKVMVARDKYKNENHIRRWERRYGKKYLSEGEVGSLA